MGSKKNQYGQFFYMCHGSDPTQTYFWPAVNKRPNRLWPGYFLTQPKEIFFDPKGKKLKNLTFLGEIFKIQTQTINGWPNLTRSTKNWPKPTWVKKFDLDPSLGQKPSTAESVAFGGSWISSAQLLKHSIFITSLVWILGNIVLTKKVGVVINCRECGSFEWNSTWLQKRVNEA